MLSFTLPYFNLQQNAQFVERYLLNVSEYFFRVENLEEQGGKKLKRKKRYTMTSLVQVQHKHKRNKKK